MSGRLRVYVVATSVLGLVALITISAAIRVDPAISPRIPGLSPEGGILLGLAYWSLLTVLASAMSVSLPTGGVLLFIAMPITAAMLVGGPAATVWVVALGTTELRELRGRVPWYGTISNHAQLLLAALSGALVVQLVRAPLDGVIPGTVAPGALAATILGGGTYLVVDVLISSFTAALRTGQPWRSVIALLPGSYWASQAGVVLLAWLMADAYVVIGWWVPLLVIASLLTIWRAFDVDTAHWAAAHDPLTDLLNRRAFHEQLESVTSAVRRGHGSAALLVVDLDGFKAVNDAMGHAAGDEVLRITARRLRQATRAHDILGRLGGDEFGVVLPGVGEPGAVRQIADRVDRVLGQPIHLDGATRVVGASVGAALIDASRSDISAIFNEADRAMYRAKQAHLEGIEL